MESGADQVILSRRSSIWNPEWLPADRLPALDALAGEHRRLLGLYADLTDEATALHERFDGEDAARAEAQRAIVAGEEATVPEATSEPERTAAFAAVAERATQVVNALFALGRQVLDTAERDAEAWLGEQVDKEAERLTAIEALRAQIAEHENAMAENRRLVAWIARTSGRRWKTLAARLIAFPLTPVPPLDGPGGDPAMFMDRREDAEAAPDAEREEEMSHA